MIWLFALSLLIFLLGLVFWMPFMGVRMALRNTHRSDGSQSPDRTRRELRHFGKLAWRTIGRPTAGLILALVGMLVFHYHAMPDSTLADLFGEHHPEVSLNAQDLEAWYEAIEAKKRDDDYKKWRERQGFDPRTKPTLRQRITGHWPIHLVVLLMSWIFAVWFVLRRTPHHAAAYEQGVVKRAREYLHYDLDTAFQADAASPSPA